jgi:hypothetical protein
MALTEAEEREAFLSKSGRRNAMKRTPLPPITEPTQFGTIVAVAKFMRVGRTWLSAVKKRAKKLEFSDGAVEPVFNPWVGGVTRPDWVEAFLKHPRNRGWAPTSEYKKQPTQPAQGRAPSTSGKSDAPPRPRGQRKPSPAKSVSRPAQVS